jgi:hypothetical protein
MNCHFFAAYGLPAWFTNGFFVFHEREHTAEGRRINLSATFVFNIYTKDAGYYSSGLEYW